jgi:superfamily II DNA or RNA helicase
MISRKGYIIEKSSLGTEQLAKIKDDLTVEPIINNNYGQQIEKFYVYSENEKRICVPKFYGLKELGQPEQYLEPKFDKIKIKFKGVLKDQQLEPFNITLNGLKEKFGGILSIPCGGGKTVITLALISALQVKTLVIVHKTFLANQWKERIAQFIPKARIGIIQQNKVDIENKDIVIAMLQSISMKTYDKSVFSRFGFVIVDEVHRISSKVFSRALPKTSNFAPGFVVPMPTLPVPCGLKTM